MRNDNEPLQARVEPVSSWSKVWLVPMVALGIGIWMVYLELSQQGPMITIEFQSAEGLEAGKTRIKTRDVDVGTVKEIKLAPGSEGVLVTARMSQEAESLLTEDASFWVVSPKVSLSGVSGLSTLLSGAYIELSPGSSGQTATQFRGLDDPPLTPAGAPGLHLTLSSGEEFAFSEGDPIIYKGLTVGKFENVYFNYAERMVYYNAFIHAPYHLLITRNTRFWNASGIKLDLGAEGISMHTGTLQTLLTNGVTFGVPDHLPAGDMITERSFFHIYPNAEKASAPHREFSQDYLVLMEDSVKGLQVGAPVEHRGLVIGEVLAVNMPMQDMPAFLDRSYHIPVLLALYPGEMGLKDSTEGREQLTTQMDNWISQGLRATLSMGNLLTGKQFVDLQYHPRLAPEQLVSLSDYRVIPTIPGDFSQLTQKLTALLDKFNDLPLEQLSTDTGQMMNSANNTMEGLQTTLSKLNSLLTDVEDKQLINQLTHTLAGLEGLSADYASDSTGYGELRQMMRRFEQTMLQLQPLLQQLNQNPNRLIFGGAVKEREPQAKGNSND
ncbi:intermembrane transport protein PqiB [Bowmanella dokdonensis]|uniref:Intermembrane transport protein PqiB n=1 Tax=Bowmanella dokdonensis TaxID=751969 RepID=A0A939DPQ3_9ALTE|nr:intermembrane transport protein PqiB [Bowmanella dokdonensis]MBN7826388.1 intermembrane transport protein PqiB [Bowmanella dokdonensis]